MTPLNPNPIQIGPFLGALILAPLLIAALFFWALYIPVVAVYLGAPVYLTFGAAAYALTIRFIGDHPLLLMIAGVLANMAAYPLLSALNDAGMIDNPLSLYWGFGNVFAGIWSLLFGVLYRSFWSEVA